MEKIVTDLINVGIALFRSGEEGVKKAAVDMEKLFNELKSKGETDQSEKANQLRELLNKTIRDSKDVLSKVDGNYKDIITKLQMNYENLSKQVDTLVPEQVKSGLQTGLAELKKVIDKVKSGA